MKLSYSLGLSLRQWAYFRFFIMKTPKTSGIPKVLSRLYEYAMIMNITQKGRIKMNNKLLYISLVTLIMLSLAGCAQKQETTAPNDSATEATSVASQKKEPIIPDPEPTEFFLHHFKYNGTYQLCLVDNNGEKIACITDDVKQALTENAIDSDSITSMNCYTYLNGIFYFNIKSEANNDSGLYALQLSDNKLQKVLSAEEILEYLDYIDYHNGKLYIGTSDYGGMDELLYTHKEYVFTISDNFTFKKEVSPYENILNKMEEYDIITIPYYSAGTFSLARAFDEIGYVIGQNHYSGNAKIFPDGTITPLDLIDQNNESSGEPQRKHENILYYDNNEILYTTNKNETGTILYRIKADQKECLKEFDNIDHIKFCNNKMYYISENSLYEFDVQSKEAKTVHNFTEIDPQYISGSYDYQYTIENGMVFVVDLVGYELKWLRIDSYDDGASVVDIDCPVETLNIIKYGTVEKNDYEIKCPRCKNTVGEVHYSSFQLKDEYSDYASKINSILKKKNDPVDEYIEDSGNDENCEYHMDPDHFITQESISVDDVDIINSRFLVVNMDYAWEGGGPHGDYHFNQYIFDLTTGEELTVQNFFDGTEDDFKALIAEKVQKEFALDKDRYYFETEEEAYNGGYKVATMDDPDSEHIFFEDDHIIYDFGRYTFCDYAAGSMAVTVSYEELNGNKALTRIK